MSLEGSHLGRFRLLRLLGRGGMGEVYLAEDDQLRRQVAIKVIQTEHPDPDATRLFQREARAIAMLDHPRILPLFDFGEANIHGTTLTYMVMPFCKEGTLATWMQERRNTALPSLQDVGRIIQQAASALQYAHDHQVVHQDVKPSNFLIRSSEDAAGCPDLMLADFGVAKSMNATASVSQSVRGTPTYMAPEQWDGTPVAASDQYALAIMAYDLLMGHPPFQGNLGQVMYQHFYVSPQPPGKLDPRISTDVDAVILRALAKKPEERFGSISAFARAFQQALSVDSPGPALANTPQESESNNIPATLVISEPEASSDATTIISASALDARGVTELAPSPRTTVSTEATNRRHGSLAFVLIGLALLVVVGSGLGILYFARNNLQNPPSPPATSSSQQIPYPPYGKLALADSLSANNHGYSWSEGSDSFGSCVFTGGAYHVTGLQQPGQGCIAGSNDPPTSFSDFAYQVEMTIVKGDGGDILFRDDTNGNGYYFSIGQDGTYTVGIYSGCNGANTCKINTLRNASSTAIHIGLNQTNVVAVVASGGTIDLYVNNQKIDSVSASRHSQGHIGVGAAYENNLTEVVFGNVKVWTR